MLFRNSEKRQLQKEVRRLKKEAKDMKREALRMKKEAKTLVKKGLRDKKEELKQARELEKARKLIQKADKKAKRMAKETLPTEKEAKKTLQAVEQKVRGAGEDLGEWVKKMDLEQRGRKVARLIADKAQQGASVTRQFVDEKVTQLKDANLDKKAAKIASDLRQKTGEAKDVVVEKAMVAKDKILEGAEKVTAAAQKELEKMKK